MTRVVIYGASGFTGRLTARVLADLGVDLVLSGRDRSRLEQVAGEVGGRAAPAPVHDPRALAAAMAGADVVISTAGPFALVGEPVLRAAIDAGCDYLDSTGEQAFMREMYERYESAARKRGVCVVSGCAFEIAVGDWAAARAAAATPGTGELDEVEVYYAIDQFRPSAGTRLSALDSLARPGVVWSVDRWQEIAPARQRRAVSFPELGERTAISFPSGEVITVPRHVRTRWVQTYLAPGGLGRVGGLLGGVLAPALPILARSPLVDRARARSASARPPSEDERRANRFAVVARARRGFEESRVAVVGRDIYGLTATILGRAATELAARRDTAERPIGALAPSQAFDPEESLLALDQAGCTVLE